MTIKPMNANKILINRPPNPTLPRRWLTQDTKIGTDLSLLEQFRAELYQPSSTHRKKVVRLREQRLQLQYLYLKIKSTPSAYTLLTHDDLDTLISLFTPRNPDLKRLSPIHAFATQVLEDMHDRNLHFTPTDAERLIELYGELGKKDKIVALAAEQDKAGHPLSHPTLRSMIRCAALSGDMSLAKQWVDILQQEDPFLVTLDVVGYLVCCWLRAGNSGQAAAVVRHHVDLFRLQPYSSAFNHWDTLDDPGILTAAMDAIIYETSHRYRLTDAVNVYQQARALGLLANKHLGNLAKRCVFSLQMPVADLLFDTAITSGDTAGAVTVGDRMVLWHIYHHNVRGACDIIYALDAKEALPVVDTLVHLIHKASSARYHTDALRLFDLYKKRQPSNMDRTVYTSLVKCLAFSKQYTKAKELFTEYRAIVPLDALDVNMLHAMYAVCAQTGDIDLFFDIFSMHEKSNLKVTYKTLTSLTACYVSLGDTDHAKKIFRTISESPRGPDVIDFNVLIRAVILSSTQTVAEAVSGVLRHLQMVNIKPVPSTFRTLLLFCDDHAVKEKIYDMMLNDRAMTKMDHVWLNNIRLTQMANELGPHEAIEAFMSNDRNRLFPSCHGQRIMLDGMTYKILFDATLRSVDTLEESILLMDHMRKRGLRPESSVYHKLMSSWKKLGRIDQVHRIQNMYNTDYGISPTN